MTKAGNAIDEPVEGKKVDKEKKVSAVLVKKGSVQTAKALTKESGEWLLFREGVREREKKRGEKGIGAKTSLRTRIKQKRQRGDIGRVVQ